ncbi:hypothetical protein ABZP36_003080 [Zizania latifolia]
MVSGHRREAKALHPDGGGERAVTVVDAGAVAFDSLGSNSPSRRLLAWNAATLAEHPLLLSSEGGRALSPSLPDHPSVRSQRTTLSGTRDPSPPPRSRRP